MILFQTRVHACFAMPVIHSIQCQLRFVGFVKMSINYKLKSSNSHGYQIIIIIHPKARVQNMMIYTNTCKSMVLTYSCPYEELASKN